MIKNCEKCGSEDIVTIGTYKIFPVLKCKSCNTRNLDDCDAMGVPIVALMASFFMASDEGITAELIAKKLEINAEYIAQTMDDCKSGKYDTEYLNDFGQFLLKKVNSEQKQGKDESLTVFTNWAKRAYDSKQKRPYTPLDEEDDDDDDDE